MLSISIAELATMMVILALLGGIIGYVVGTDRAKRAGNPDDLDAMRRELDDYRQGVSAHFQETAELMQQMTGNYRTLYTHMARGADALCDMPDGDPRLAALQRESRALAGVTAVETGASRSA